MEHVRSSRTVTRQPTRRRQKFYRNSHFNIVVGRRGLQNAHRSKAAAGYNIIQRSTLTCNLASGMMSQF